MARVKVRNLNVHPFEQKYQGKLIRLEAKGQEGDTVEMDDDQAHIFVGMFSPFKVDNKGQHDPRYFKMLKVEKGPDAQTSGEAILHKFACQACKEQTSSWIELEAHMRLMHSDNLLRDAEYEKYQAEKAKNHGAIGKASAGASPAPR